MELHAPGLVLAVLKPMISPSGVQATSSSTSGSVSRSTISE